MKIYPSYSRGSYSFDKSQVKKLIVNLLVEQWNGYLTLDIAWGSIPDYIKRNQANYFVTQILENEDDLEDDIVYSKWRKDVWFGRYYNFRSIKNNFDFIEFIDEEDDVIMPNTKGYVKQWYITIKLGSFYQWRYKGKDYSPQE